VSGEPPGEKAEGVPCTGVTRVDELSGCCRARGRSPLRHCSWRAPAVSAAPLEREHYSFTDSFTFDDCGCVVQDEVTGQGLFMLKQGHAGDPTPYLFDNYDVTETITNPANGEWITITHNGLYKDLRITNVEGTVYDFVAIETGQPFVVRDMDGKVILRDRGNLVRYFTVDTLGDSDLDNDVFIEGSFSFVDHGAHPGFNFDFCAMLTEQIG
jgi:hypothetical protein